MATRPVYRPLDHKPYFQMVDVDFTWNPGLAPSQKKKNAAAIRESFMERYPDARYMEVSTKSDTDLGTALSPFNLTKYVPSLAKRYPVENVFQASKVFEYGGPFIDLLNVEPLLAKRDERKKNSGELVSFQFEGENYPIAPDILYYNWLYINALLDNPELAKQVENFDAFSDVEFSPTGGKTNNQARACAIYSSLARNNLLSKVRDFNDFKELFTGSTQAPAVAKKPVVRTVKPKRRRFNKGDWIEHPNIGKGEILNKDSRFYTIRFNISGTKKIAKEYVELNCKPLLVDAYENL